MQQKAFALTVARSRNKEATARRRVCVEPNIMLKPNFWEYRIRKSISSTEQSIILSIYSTLICPKLLPSLHAARWHYTPLHPHWNTFNSIPRGGAVNTRRGNNAQAPHVVFSWHDCMHTMTYYTAVTPADAAFCVNEARHHSGTDETDSEHGYVQNQTMQHGHLRTAWALGRFHPRAIWNLTGIIHLTVLPDHNYD